MNYPCGTQELAESVAELIDREPDPAHAVIGLRNHGITATGENLTEILDRIAAEDPPPGADDLGAGLKRLGGQRRRAGGSGQTLTGERAA